MAEYRIETAGLLSGTLYRKSEDQGVTLYHKWSPVKQRWVPSEDAAAAFAPESSSEPLTPEQAQARAKELCRSWTQLNWEKL